MADAITYRFYIYFFGLICHVGNGSRKHYAAIVRDDEHDPVIRYDDGLDGGIGKNDPIYADTESVKFEIGIPKEGKITESDAEVTPDFIKYVPSLQALMGGNTRINIKEYAIPVYYPESMGERPDLDAIQLYGDAAYYHRFGVKLREVDCVARLNGVVVDVLNSNYKLRVVQIKQNGDRLYTGPFDPGSCIVIGNLPRHEHGEGHVMRYGQILIGNDSLVSVVRPYLCRAKEKWTKTVRCPWVYRWLDGPASTDVECGNTGWP